jgi:hypothetical protein
MQHLAKLAITPPGLVNPLDWVSGGRAKKVYAHSFQNRHIIDDRDDLVPGWTLRIPEVETSVA